MDENEFIAYLRQRLAVLPPLKVGIGDDAALFSLPSLPLDLPPSEAILTTDMLMEGVHFELKQTDPWRIGHKALAVNLSDCAAMAAIPKLAVVSLALPQGFSLADLERLYGGMLALAEKYHTLVCGGDTNAWSGPLVINVTLYGETTAKGAVLRSGAKVGDAILVSGELGGSLLGKHYDFLPRVEEALFLHQHYPLSAMMDLSDGLASDLTRLCKASQLGALIEAAKLPLSSHVKDKADGIKAAMTDGEDFELLFTLEPQAAETLLESQALPHCPFHRIGEVIAEPGVFFLQADGSKQPLPWQGFMHRW